MYILLTVALEGFALAVGSSDLPSMLLAAGGGWILCRIALAEGAGAREYIPVTIKHKGKTLHLTALRDTGNMLLDPVTGERVLVISAEAAEELTGLTRSQLKEPLETMGKIPGLRLIPYRTVGQAAGMLLAMRISEVKLGRRWKSTVVAFATEGLDGGKMYQALAGGAL